MVIDGNLDLFNANLIVRVSTDHHDLSPVSRNQQSGGAMQNGGSALGADQARSPKVVRCESWPAARSLPRICCFVVALPCAWPRVRVR